MYQIDILPDRDHRFCTWSVNGQCKITGIKRGIIDRLDCRHIIIVMVVRIIDTGHIRSCHLPVAVTGDGFLYPVYKVGDDGKMNLFSIRIFFCLLAFIKIALQIIISII